MPKYTVMLPEQKVDVEAPTEDAALETALQTIRTSIEKSDLIAWELTDTMKLRIRRAQTTNDAA